MTWTELSKVRNPGSPQPCEVTELAWLTTKRAHLKADELGIMLSADHTVLRYKGHFRGEYHLRQYQTCSGLKENGCHRPIYSNALSQKCNTLIVLGGLGAMALLRVGLLSLPPSSPLISLSLWPIDEDVAFSATPPVLHLPVQ